MRHASPATLDALEPLLAEIRQVEGIVERKRGIWYHRSRAFLHFHEDPAGLLRGLEDRRRLRALPRRDGRERRALLARVRRAVRDAGRG